MTAKFREFVPPEDSPRYSGLDADAETYSDNMIGLMRLGLGQTTHSTASLGRRMSRSRA